MTTREIVEEPSAKPKRKCSPRCLQLRQESKGLPFFTKLQLLTDDDWNHALAQVSRYHSKTGEPPEDGDPEKAPRGAAYTKVKFSAPFSIDDIARELGGGNYWILLTYDSQVAFSGYCRIEGEPRTTGEAKSSLEGGDEGWKQFVVDLVKKQMDQNQNPKPDQAVSDILATMKTTNERYAAMLERALEKEKPATDPMAALSTVLDVASKIKESAPANGAAGESALLDKLSSLGLLRGSSSQGDPLDLVSRTLEKLRNFGLIPNATAGGSGAADWRVALAENAPMLMQHAEAIVARITTAIIAGRTMTPAGIAAANPTAAIVGQQAPDATTGTEGQAGQGLTAAQSQQAAQQIVESFLWTRIRDLFLTGYTAEQVAGFLQLYSPEMATRLSAATKADLEMLIAGHPLLHPMVGHPKLPAFLDEFVAYFNAPPEGDDGDEEEKPEAA
ncbi:MAG TPA: hypothetical protein VGR84_19130 [Candidatus Acidoferrales bacterium]|nr:hypothetical protein [Candidatus Acidoferrales bacterium]